MMTHKSGTEMTVDELWTLSLYSAFPGVPGGRLGLFGIYRYYIPDDRYSMLFWLALTS